MTESTYFHVRSIVTLESDPIFLGKQILEVFTTLQNPNYLVRKKKQNTYLLYQHYFVSVFLVVFVILISPFIIYHRHFLKKNKNEKDRSYLLFNIDKDDDSPLLNILMAYGGCR